MAASTRPLTRGPAVSNLQWAQYVLDNYATVAEALDGLKIVQIVSNKAAGREWPLHLAIEDATGDSAVLEYVGGKLVIHHGKQVTVMTNEPTLDEQLANLKRYKLFGGNLPMPGDVDPASRFVRATSYLKTLPKPANTYEAVSQLAGVARNVAVPFGATTHPAATPWTPGPPDGPPSSISPTRFTMSCPSTARPCSGLTSVSSTPSHRNSRPRSLRHPAKRRCICAVEELRTRAEDLSHALITGRGRTSKSLTGSLAEVTRPSVFWVEMNGLKLVREQTTRSLSANDKPFGSRPWR